MAQIKTDNGLDERLCVMPWMSCARVITERIACCCVQHALHKVPCNNAGTYQTIMQNKTMVLY